MSNPQTIEEILRKIDPLKSVDNPEGNPFFLGNISVAEALVAIDQLIREKVIGEYEKKVALPVVQQQEQNNYDKDVRNELRVKQCHAFSQVIGKEKSYEK